MSFLSTLNEFLTSSTERLERNKTIEIYSEAGLQHQLALYLNQKGYNVQLELNVNILQIEPNDDLGKKEIDLVAVKGNKRYVVEIKLIKPNSGRPNLLYGVLEDLEFCENLSSDKSIESYILCVNIDARLPYYRGAFKLGKMFKNDEQNLRSVSVNDMPATPAKKLAGRSKNGILLKGKSYPFQWKNLIEYKVLQDESKSDFAQYFIIQARVS
jgi:hypothetical protein